MNKRNFPAHGKLNLTVEKDLLIINGEGPGNLEVVLQYQRDVQQYRDQLNHAPWASLVRLAGVPLLPPEAKGLLIDTIRYASTQNLVATAIVFVDVEYADVIKKFWTSIYQQTPLPYQFFDNSDDARLWLEARIARSSGTASPSQ